MAALRGNDLLAYLTAHSGLPGPRANLGLADTAAQVVSPAQMREFAASDDEFLALCGAIGLGELLARGDDTVAQLREMARDARWRVREGVARGLQRLGDAAPGRLRDLATTWAHDADPLVQRAAIAVLCEPRLLKDPLTAAAALDACAVVTVALLAAPSRDRVLRQALGYCWSVAIAASPERGLTEFRKLQDNPDPDAQWIVRENTKKVRLSRLL